MTLARYDALLLVSFGGPEKPADVIPFLANVTRGSGIPESRLAEVGEHYLMFGGRSPINDQCRALRAALAAELTARGHNVSVFWGNRHWEPYLADAVDELVSAGHRRVLAVVTAAYPSYSGCRSYREALSACAERHPGLTVDVLTNYARDEGFRAANLTAVRDAVAQLQSPRLVFVTHSIPSAMAVTAGPPESRSDEGEYVAWHREVAHHITDRLVQEGSYAGGYDLVYCSRSGPPSQPWLEPDVNDHLERLAIDGVTEVVLAPIGFISDHMEVIYDLDTQAADTARRLGMTIVRAGTAGVKAPFVQGLVDLVLERDAPGAEPSPVAAFAARSCGAGCCPAQRRPSPS